MANDRAEPGPTGDYPDGKLNDDDKGGLMMAIQVENGNIRIDFGTPTAWFALDPDAAIAFAAALTGTAMRIKRGSVDG